MTNNTLKSVPWLTGTAIWTLAVASGAVNVWGWMATAQGLIAFVLAALVISSEVLGIRLAVHVAARAAEKAWGRLAIAIALLGGVVAFNALSGHRALSHYESLAAAPAIDAEAKRDLAQAEVARLEAQVAAIPALRSDIPRVRLAELRAARDAELARLEPLLITARARLEAAPPPAAPPEPIGSTAVWLIVALIESLKAFGFVAVSCKARAGSVQARQVNHAAELARKRWGMREAS